MPHKLQVSCIVPANGTGRNAYIEAVGGKAADGVWWFVSQQEAISGIEHARWKFVVNDELGAEHELVVAETEEGRKYLTCDGASVPHLLLKLRSCPATKQSAMH